MTYGRDGIALQSRGQRPGVCHRCGWRGIVGTLHRRDREILGSGQHYGRLCQECVSDLLHAAPARQKVDGSRLVDRRVAGSRQMAWASAATAGSSS
jgi:hypothetical protein